MLVYIGIAIVDHHHTPQYPMPAETAYLLKLAWAVSVFVITIFFLQLFAYMATEMQKQLKEEALHDKLTGLHNRFYMNDRLQVIMNGGGGWLAIADIDDFKRVNDQYGHNCGDYVLRVVASQIKKLEPEAEVCRWGGEEFLIVGKNVSGMDAVVELLDELRRNIENYHFEYKGQALHKTITIGAAESKPDETVESWVDRADTRLYEGKNSGKNKVVA
jgi:diguanylate cyclase (GGDEF)-like protein